MDHATVAAALLATSFAAALLPLTLRLLPVISRVGQLVVNFRAAELTPSACYQFETQLRDALRELGRIIVEWTYNHLEPDDRHLMPGHLRFDGDWYRRRDKTPNRSVATLFGTITLWRHLDQPIHGVERSIFPLEIRLGLAAGRATPALAERVARAAADSTPAPVTIAVAAPSSRLPSQAELVDAVLEDAASLGENPSAQRAEMGVYAAARGSLEVPPVEVASPFKARKRRTRLGSFLGPPRTPSA